MTVHPHPVIHRGRITYVMSTCRDNADMPDTPQLRWWLLSQGDELVVLDKITAVP
jgi:hypothetical protein